MIGDNPQADLAYAKAAGIEQVILPRREQPQPWIVEEDGGIYVDSLAIVPEFLEFRRC
jgi:FMN phosphatase YigB (HAD superfamily)